MTFHLKGLCSASGCGGMKRYLVVLLLALLTGCHSVRQAEAPAGPHFRLLTYNVNWGRPRPELAAEIIQQSGADIVCLQETTPQWEQFLRSALSNDYPFAQFRNSKTRILFSPELHCCSARVIRAGASDHFPVEAVFAGVETSKTLKR
jgi:endonuclease/exonuclease/phosphatase family metal-dependent hydrolase